MADMAGSMYFLELALDTVRKMLNPGATLAVKMLQGQVPMISSKSCASRSIKY
ncbi:MAG: hypothetical protein ABI821_10085 [Pseudomonadota bacterium]